MCSQQIVSVLHLLLDEVFPLGVTPGGIFSFISMTLVSALLGILPASDWGAVTWYFKIQESIA